MRGIFAILAGLGVGAAVMYLFDPEGGNRRRALLRDKAIKLNRQARETIDGSMKDLSNRAKGTMHEMRSGFSSRGDSEFDRSQTSWSDGPAV